MNTLSTYFYLMAHFIFHIHDYLVLFFAHYGQWIYILLFIIIFCETGIILAATLPGDSLLFAAGAIAASGDINIHLLWFFLVWAAFIGNTLNYWVGRYLGHWLFRNEKSVIFRHSYLQRTHDFYERHGIKTIVIGSFLPIIRTFAPFVAGMSKMHSHHFMAANIIGAIFWMTIMLYGSYFFGGIPWVKNHFSVIVLVIIFISILPPVIEMMRMKIMKK